MKPLLAGVASAKFLRSLSRQFATVVGAAVLISAILIAAISYVLNQRTLSQDTFRKLGSLATLQANALEAHFQGLSQVLVTAAQMPELQSVSRQLNDAFSIQRGQAAPDAFRQPGGGSDLLERGEYARLHGKLHPLFKSLNEKFGFGDFYLIDPASGTVVYSFLKGAETGSLLEGEASVKSALGQAFRMALREKAGNAWLSDYQAYKLASDEHVAFMSVPVTERGTVQSVLVARVPIDRINQVMNLSGRWKQSGLGRTGETVLVARDGSLRSVSRDWLTQSPEYLKRLSESLGPKQADLVKAHDSDVGLVHMPAPLVSAMLQESAGSGVFDFQKKAQLVAFAPVRLLNQSYQVVAKMSSAEAFEALGRQVLPVLVIGAVAALALAILAAMLARPMFRRWSDPLERANETLATPNQGRPEAGPGRASSRESGGQEPGPNHFLDQQVRKLQATTVQSEKLNQSVLGIMQTVGSLVPTADAELRNPVDDALSAAISDALKMLTGETCKVLQSVGLISSDLARATLALQRKVASVPQIQAQQLQLPPNSGNPADTPAVADAHAPGDALAARDAEADSEILQRMQRLGERSFEVSQGVALLYGLSERTGILALNASMHAAAAGEAGRGFALIAIEVKRLADSAREATNLIARLVSSIRAPGGQSDLDMYGKVQEISRLAERVDIEMRRTQLDAEALSHRIREMGQRPIEGFRATTQDISAGEGIKDAGLETLRQLQAQANETKRLVDYAKTLLREVQVHKQPE